MNSKTLEALIDELGSIEKNAGVREAAKALKSAPSQVADKVKKVSAKALQHPKVQTALRYATDPMNTADFAHGITNLSRFVS